MKKLFISCPMKGRTEENIRKSMERMKVYVVTADLDDGRYGGNSMCCVFDTEEEARDFLILLDIDGDVTEVILDEKNPPNWEDIMNGIERSRHEQTD